MPSEISEQTLDIDEELGVCFINWQNAFDSVDWTKLMQILNGTGIDRYEKKKYLSANCAWITVLRYDWTEGRREV
jgi:hypothetical protein